MLVFIFIAGYVGEATKCWIVAGFSKKPASSIFEPKTNIMATILQLYLAMPIAIVL
jgi:hypothetical protein